LSKKFIPEGSPQPSVSKTTFEMIWHPFEGKEYSPILLEHFKEIESKILKQARDKALFVEKEAYEKGFAQGEKDGLAMGEKRLEAITQQLKNILAETESQRGHLYKTYEKEMLQLVLSIAKKIVHREVKQSEELILSTLKESLRHVVDQRKITVHVNPVDYQHLLVPSSPSPALLGESERIQLVKDPSVTRGGCLIETAFGDVDGTIEGQLDRIVSLVWEGFEKTGPFSHPEAT
jgi:flagellar assembly protein FliH